MNYKSGTCQNCDEYSDKLREYDLCSKCFSQYYIWSMTEYDRKMRRVRYNKYYHRHKDDPEWLAKTNEKRRARYHKRMRDPKEREKYNEQARERNRRLSRDPDWCDKRNTKNRLNYRERRKDPKWRTRRNIIERDRKRLFRKIEKERQWKLTEWEIGFPITMRGSFSF